MELILASETDQRSSAVDLFDHPDRTPQTAHTTFASNEMTIYLGGHPFRCSPKKIKTYLDEHLNG